MIRYGIIGFMRLPLLLFLLLLLFIPPAFAAKEIGAKMGTMTFTIKRHLSPIPGKSITQLNCLPGFKVVHCQLQEWQGSTTREKKIEVSYEQIKKLEEQMAELFPPARSKKVTLNRIEKDIFLSLEWNKEGNEKTLDLSTTKQDEKQIIIAARLVEQVEKLWKEKTQNEKRKEEKWR